MSKAIVRYDNDLNQVSFRGWTGIEQDLFFGVLAKMRDKGTHEVIFDTDELRALIDFDTKQSSRRWDRILEGAARKVTQMVYVERTDHRVRIMALFQTFDLDLDARTMRVKVSENYDYIINALRARFTQFELAEFGAIRSTYAKTMYRLLKQWRTIGRVEYQLRQFRDLLGIPDSYDARKIRAKVLRPIEEELPAYFPGLQVGCLRAARRGRPITGYVFTWRPDTAPSMPWIEDRFATSSQPSSYAARTGVGKTAPAVASEPAKGDLGIMHRKWGLDYQGEWDDGALIVHFDGTVAQDECPVCAAWESNRARHGCRRATD